VWLSLDAGAIGACSNLPLSCEVLSYEAPFGVGYLVAQLTNQQARGESTSALARDAVETFIRSGNVLTPPESTTGSLASPAPCFVCLKTLEGELRGCIGTIEPARATLAKRLLPMRIVPRQTIRASLL
jgi:hypothetical protein